MANDRFYWKDLRGEPVFLAGGSRQFGIIEDFYYDPETMAINALRVKAGLGGYLILLSSAIHALGRNGVAIANEQMLIPEDNAGPIYQLPLGNKLPGFRVLTEQGNEVGIVRNLLLGIDPLVALRVAALQLDRGIHISAHEITHFSDGELSIIEQAGRNVH